MYLRFEVLLSPFEWRYMSLELQKKSESVSDEEEERSL